MSESDLYFAGFNQHIAVIDLHSSNDIFSALEQLEKELFLFYQKGEKYCRVVHGIGSGKLGLAVHEALKKNPMVVKFQEEESGGSCIVSL